METRANYLLVGSFVLAGIAGLFAFVMWMANNQNEDDLTYYDVFFGGSVAGLSVGGDVRYRGVRVGKVSTVRIDENDPGRVRVTVAVTHPYVLRDGDVATLQMQGVTGVSYINIDGAAAGNAPLKPVGENNLAVVASAPSQIDRIFAGAPELLAKTNELAAELKLLLDEDNRERVERILQDVETLTGSLARGAPEVERAMVSLGLIANAADAIRSLGTTVDERAPELMNRVDEAFSEIATTARTADAAIEQIAPALTAVQLSLKEVVPVLTQNLSEASNSLVEVPGLVDELSMASQAVRQAADAAGQILIVSRRPIAGFMGDGLTELYRFITEARQLVSGLTRLTDRLEQDGPGFIFQGSNEGFEVK